MKKLLRFFQGDLPFSPVSTDYKQSLKFIFASWISVLTYLFYIIQNFSANLDTLASIQCVMLAVLIANYLYFRFRYQILLAAYGLMFTVSTVTISAVHLPGIVPEGVLFWLAALPMFTFLMLGLRHGFYWNIVNFIALIAVTVLSTFPYTNPYFSTVLLIQTLFGYLIVSAILYYFEYQRALLETRLDHSLKEQKILLKEVHHRVKNNMQVMMGLLWLQSQTIKEPAYAKLFTENIDRLSAMALIHEKLYTSDNLERIDLIPYFDAIIANTKKITDCKIETNFIPLTVDIKTAMNLGLILNEALNNALKYAFNDPDQGTIAVTLDRDEQRISFGIKDNGMGFEPDAINKEGVGLTLIEDLSKSLHHGHMQLDTLEGTSITVYFDLTDSYDA